MRGDPSVSGDLFWALLWIFLFYWALEGVSRLAIKWTLKRDKRKWESDDELLIRHKRIKETLESQGEAFDIRREISAAIAKQDWQMSERARDLAIAWAPFLQWAGQLVIVYFAYQAYEANEIGLLLVLLFVFLWRSINYRHEKQRMLQTVVLARLHVANPNAEQDFFNSEHCYDSGIRDRVYDILKKDGYFERGKHLASPHNPLEQPKPVTQPTDQQQPSKLGSILPRMEPR